MDSKEFRELLVKMVKASGQEVIDRAEDLVGDGDLISSFDICLRFPLDGRMLVAAPTVEVSKEYISKNTFDVLMEKENAKEPEPEYIPVCPHGETDCVCDPAYIKHNYPDWYEELYGTLTPEEAAKNCEEHKRYPECYDDEDK